MQISLGRGPAVLLAAAVVVAGVLVGVGVFLGGYGLGQATAPTASPTELAEKVYTVDDLEGALAACQLEGVAVEDSSVTLLGAEHPGTNRQCFVVEMGATAIADREFSYGLGTKPADRPEGGEYSWSNVRMVWEQTDRGRDVTITVK